MLHVEIASRSEAGDRAHNEDDLRHGRAGLFRYAVLSDGAGGHRGGAIASDLVVRLVAHGLQSAPHPSPDYFTHPVTDTHATLGDQQQGRKGHSACTPPSWRCGSTPAAPRPCGPTWATRASTTCATARCATCTDDDSVVQRMVHAGYLSRAEARDHPRKNQLLECHGHGRSRRAQHGRDLRAHRRRRCLPALLRRLVGPLRAAGRHRDRVRERPVAAALARPDGRGRRSRRSSRARTTTPPSRSCRSAIRPRPPAWGCRCDAVSADDRLCTPRRARQAGDNLPSTGAPTRPAALWRLPS